MIGFVAEVQQPGVDQGEVNTTGEDKYDIRKIIHYPGFNVPAPPGSYDVIIGFANFLGLGFISALTVTSNNHYKQLPKLNQGLSLCGTEISSKCLLDSPQCLVGCYRSYRSSFALHTLINYGFHLSFILWIPLAILFVPFTWHGHTTSGSIFWFICKNLFLLRELKV